MRSRNPIRERPYSQTSNAERKDGASTIPHSSRTNRVQSIRPDLILVDPVPNGG